MNKKKRIKELERRVAQLERELERMRFTPLLLLPEPVIPSRYDDWRPLPQPYTDTTDGSWWAPYQYEITCEHNKEGQIWW
jgi:hypothetical protein